MKYFIIAGEASGDLHASNLVKQLRRLDSMAICRGWGGDLMQEQGVEILKPIHELAFMGFVEVVANLPTILRNFKSCKEQILEFKPDVVLCVDYPGFNLRMVEWAKKKGYKTAYYISPTVWAWKENRIEKIRKYVDEMMCILPFEKQFYKERGVPVHYVGHPSVGVIEEEKKKTSHLGHKKVIALLPGSRVQEVNKMLPVMLEAISAFTDYEVVIAQAPNLDRTVFEPFLRKRHFELLKYQTYDILKVSHLALVTSGTATLEAALFNVPQVVCYIANPISYAIAKRLVKVKYISLVNLILNRESVTELIQQDLTVERLREEIKSLLSDTPRRKQILSDYQELSQQLKEGDASQNAALIVFNLASDIANQKNNQSK
jgi:lipid-A-disaccharide synthase